MIATPSRRRKLALSLAALILVTALWQQAAAPGGPVSAQTGGDTPNQVIVDDATGPFRIIASATGTRSVVGPQRITVRVLDAVSSQPVTDASISVFGTPPHGGRRLVSPALKSPGDGSTYVSQIVLDDEGLWVIDVEVTAGLVSAAANGTLEVEPRVRGGSSVPYGTAVLALIVFAFVAAVGWLVYQSKKALRLRDEAAKARRSGS